MYFFARNQMENNYDTRMIIKKDHCGNNIFEFLENKNLKVDTSSPTLKCFFNVNIVSEPTFMTTCASKWA